MRFDDLVFESHDCCGQCAAATVDLDDGRQLAVVPRDDGLFNVSYFGPDGLIGREASPWSREQVEVILPP